MQANLSPYKLFLLLKVIKAFQVKADQLIKHLKNIMQQQ